MATTCIKVENIDRKLKFGHSQNRKTKIRFGICKGSVPAWAQNVNTQDCPSLKCWYPSSKNARLEPARSSKNKGSHITNQYAAKSDETDKVLWPLVISYFCGRNLRSKYVQGLTKWQNNCSMFGLSDLSFRFESFPFWKNYVKQTNPTSS